MTTKFSLKTENTRLHMRIQELEAALRTIAYPCYRKASSLNWENIKAWECLEGKNWKGE